MDKPAPKKRGRKPKKKTNEVKPPPKKRGRKPKGGKIIKKSQIKNKFVVKHEQNVILHLKCKSTDIKNNEISQINYTPVVENVESFNLQSNNKLNSLGCEIVNEKKQKKKPTVSKQNNNNNSNNNSEQLNDKEIYDKIRELKINLHYNNLSDKQCNCFWCTESFDNPTIYIPKRQHNLGMDVYGCFCSPQCAVAFLKKEDISMSILWERYALLNNIYGKIYNYENNIKPAPSPFYTLDKYYGNLTIQEYRKLLKNDMLLFGVGKPLTKILPELYEENNEIPNIYNNLLTEKAKPKNNNKYRLKSSEKKNTKSSILSNSFNIS